MSDIKVGLFVIFFVVMLTSSIVFLTPFAEAASGKVCGDTLCIGPMTTDEKIQKFLSETKAPHTEESISTLDDQSIFQELNSTQNIQSVLAEIDSNINELYEWIGILLNQKSQIEESAITGLSQQSFGTQFGSKSSFQPFGVKVISLVDEKMELTIPEVDHIPTLESKAFSDSKLISKYQGSFSKFVSEKNSGNFEFGFRINDPDFDTSGAGENYYLEIRNGSGHVIFSEVINENSENVECSEDFECIMEAIKRKAAAKRRSTSEEVKVPPRPSTPNNDSDNDDSDSENGSSNEGSADDEEDCGC